MVCLIEALFISWLGFRDFFIAACRLLPYYELFELVDYLGHLRWEHAALTLRR